MSLSIKQINFSTVKTGDKFKACKRDGKIVGGIIHKGSTGAVYLCQNSWDGSVATNKHGFRYSWSIGYGIWKKGKDNIIGLEIISSKKTKYSSTISKLEKELAEVKLKEAEELAKIKAETEFPKMFKGWKISKLGTNYSFGCGSVKFSKIELAAFNKVMSELKRREPSLAKDRTKFYDEAIVVSGKLSK